jgi:hypothetical protein
MPEAANSGSCPNIDSVTDPNVALLSLYEVFSLILIWFCDLVTPFQSSKSSNSSHNILVFVG